MHDIFNPGKDDFAEIIRLSDEGEPDLENLKYMKLTTKDLVAPSSMNTKKDFVDHGILNEKGGNKTFFRAFFISTVPKDISQSFISDITNTSSNMLFSVIYEPVNEKVGLKAASKIVKFR